MHKLVLLRHGQSIWNLENRFTGWVDVDLTEQGRLEAKSAGTILKQEGYEFDIAFTSVLLRANKTLELALQQLGQSTLPVQKSWRLNERHYGSLQGLNKAETAAKYGDDKVFEWRRSFDIPPPELSLDDKNHPSQNPVYKDVPQSELPGSEDLKKTIDRVLPYWESHIAPALRENKRVLVVAHGNSLRALVKYLDHISNDEITKLNIPTGVPLVYELDDQLKPLKHYYLGDQEKIAKEIESVANQTKAK